MMKHPVLGVDIGSVSAALVLMSGRGEILGSAYEYHKGMIRETLGRMLEDVLAGPRAATRTEAGAAYRIHYLDGIACTSSTPQILDDARRVDSAICYMGAAKRFHGTMGALLIVGGEKFALMRFDGEGNFTNLKSSTSCAAGTGSFLDQQARRLGLSGSSELARRALENQERYRVPGTACGKPSMEPRQPPPELVPAIASRCSVFAKTDLSHAQQAGYSLEEICDGLCLGLARTIADTISDGRAIPPAVHFAGGVARNRAVARHLENLLGCRLVTGETAHLYGAAGACLDLLEACRLEAREPEERPVGPMLSQILSPEKTKEKKAYFHEPLSLELSRYPDFRNEESYAFNPSVVESALPVEVDIYRRLPGGTKVEAVLGVDVGSTSTKAVLVDMEKNVLAGFYTRTAGRPLTAVRALFEALDRMAGERGSLLSIAAAGTTGAGRKFTGHVLGADLIMNEITAHARAAHELNPATDTIIEIGGQDSKFTTLKDGRVTFCQMNTVCAAGTGSFIEEQAAKLGVHIGEYSRRAEGVRAPLASDRCTVFMERDINHYLNSKYSVEEILAAALFSVRENYLLKVASEALIGDVVCFQGATAKNRALVAAFEQKLRKPIFVSRYCHLTGALGTALCLLDALPERSVFRGLGLFKEEIPVRSETCELCANRCRLHLAEVRGDTVAYGFLCGRDYEVKRYVSSNRSGFDLLREYERAFDGGRGAKTARGSESEVGSTDPGAGSVGSDAVTIGIPAALHLFGELPLWKRFFAELGAEAGDGSGAAATGAAPPAPGARGVRAVTSEHVEGVLKSGKQLTGAEFCAPIAALHGHARALAGSCDFVFLPFSLEAPKEERDAGRARSYCYYTQFAPTVISIIKDSGLDGKCLTPLVEHGSLEDRGSRAVRSARNRTKRELHRVLTEKAGLPLTLRSVSRAYDRALSHYRSGARRLAELYRRHSGPEDDVKVVLVGRPYLILSRSMNKGIPDIFASLGIRCFSPEMIPRVNDSSADDALGEIEPLLDAFHWQFAARVLETAAVCARTEGLYPVLVTAFKCSPDSFVIEYFKRILDAGDKPYLILQLDEHDSNMGYETRIEAGVHSFRNHHRARREAVGAGREAGGGEKTAGGAGRAAAGPGKAAAIAGKPARRSIVPRIENSLKGKVLLFPNWDTITSPIAVANLQGAGIDARLLREDQLSIQKGMRLNTGQCIPVNAITQEMVDYMRDHDLDPERVVLWMARADWTCGIHIYPHYIKSLLEEYGGGMEKAGVYMGDVSHVEISPLLVIDTYFAYLFGGLLRRMGCTIRPYEVNKGETDRVIAESQNLLIGTFRDRGSKLAALRQVTGRFEAIPKRGGRRPKVAIFGDLYVRDNDVMNQGLIRLIEEAGGEVLTTPYSEYVQIIAAAHFRRWRKSRRYGELLKYRLMLALVRLAERRYAAHYRAYVSPRGSFRNPAVEKDLERFHVLLEHSGESYENVLKILHLLKEHPDIGLFVQTNPAFCCPSLVTEAMGRKIEELTGVPVVTLTYDGTGSPKNDLILPFLKRLTEVP